MGKQPDRHSGRLCEGRGLSAAAGTLIRTVLTLVTDTAAAVNSVTPRHRESRKPSSGEISQVVYLHTLAEHLGGNGDGNEIAPTERCEERLQLTETI
jgi:hypothetical protein